MRRSSLKRKRVPAATYAILGTGLIGTSIGLALRRRLPQARVTGYDRSPKNARAALRRGALTAMATSVEKAVTDARVIVVAVPRRNVITLVHRVLKTAPKHSLIIDVAGLKKDIVTAGRQSHKGKHAAFFIGGHPMAGNEHQGPGAASGELFEGRTFALCTPARRRRTAPVLHAEKFVRTLGARPLHVSASDHDRVVAATSALPQLVASVLAMAAANIAANHPALSGPGLSGVTRLAASPADLWAEDLIANKRNVLRALDVFEKRLRGLRQTIAAGERLRLRGFLRAGARARRRLSLR